MNLIFLKATPTTAINNATAVIKLAANVKIVPTFTDSFSSVSSVVVSESSLSASASTGLITFIKSVSVKSSKPSLVKLSVTSAKVIFAKNTSPFVSASAEPKESSNLRVVSLVDVT